MNEAHWSKQKVKENSVKQLMSKVRLFYPKGNKNH